MNTHEINSKTKWEQQCCRFQSYAKTVQSSMKYTFYKQNWQSVNHIPGIHDNGPPDHGLWRLTLTAYWTSMVLILEWFVSNYSLPCMEDQPTNGKLYYHMVIYTFCILFCEMMGWISIYFFESHCLSRDLNHIPYTPVTMLCLGDLKLPWYSCPPNIDYRHGVDRFVCSNISNIILWMLLCCLDVSFGKNKQILPNKMDCIQSVPHRRLFWDERLPRINIRNEWKIINWKKKKK